MKFEAKFPMLMLQFEKPVDYMYAIGKRYGRFFRALGNLAVLAGFLGMIVTFALLGRGAAEVLGGGPAQVGLIIPGVRVPGSPVYLPLLEGLIVIFLLAVFHEGMHGIMAGAEGIKSRYAAFLLLLFIPAAGVELDEKKIGKKSVLARLRIFAAGSMGNFILALLCVGAMIPLGHVAPAFVEADGLLVLNSSNLEFAEGAVITGINGEDATELEKLGELLDRLGPGDAVEVSTTNGTVGGFMNEEGKLGVMLQPLGHYKGPAGEAFGFLARVLALSITINIGVGLINLLPLSILDGGRMMSETSRKLYRVVSPVALILLLINLIGPYVL